MKKILKKITLIGFVFMTAFYLSYNLFVRFSPSLGGEITDMDYQRYQNSPQFKNGKFVNYNNVSNEYGFWEILVLGYKFLTTKVMNPRPKSDLTVLKLDSADISNYHQETRLVWYGHSAFLLQMKGKNILLDPMLGQVAAPHRFLGDSRFSKQLPLSINKLPKIDAVIISHDHYDHLDYESIIKLKNKTSHFFVPLGVGIHLKAWGIEAAQITELDWWEETRYQELKFVCTPAQHFSGRKMGNKPSTLWASWVIQSSDDNIFFSGDGGYASHFKKIGEKYGEFDLALMECGQYNEMWSKIHCMPEQTAQAAVDLRAKKMMPIHWAGFRLALHDWTDPIVRVTKKSKELNLPIITPRIGEKIILKDTTSTYDDWWKDL